MYCRRRNRPYSVIYMQRKSTMYYQRRNRPYNAVYKYGQIYNTLQKEQPFIQCKLPCRENLHLMSYRRGNSTYNVSYNMETMYNVIQEKQYYIVQQRYYNERQYYNAVYHMETIYNVIQERQQYIECSLPYRDILQITIGEAIVHTMQATTQRNSTTKYV